MLFQPTPIIPHKKQKGNIILRNTFCFFLPKNHPARKAARDEKGNGFLAKRTGL